MYFGSFSNSVERDDDDVDSSFMMSRFWEREEELSSKNNILKRSFSSALTEARVI